MAPSWQGSGLGTALQARLREYAVSRGIRGFTAEVLDRNARMLRLAKSAEGNITIATEDGETHVTILFADGAC